MAGLVCLASYAQQIQVGTDQAAAAKKEHVTLLTDSVELKAGHPQVVELRFRVDDGFHVNSHTPTDEYLIPTALKVDKSSGVDVLGQEYPAGMAFKLENSSDTLDVYQGEFRVRVRVIADPGQSALVGSLRYQACDHAACFPPRTLPVKVAVTGR